jgi:hypothetical protein
MIDAGSRDDFRATAKGGTAMNTVVRPHDTRGRAWTSHTLGVGIGLAIAAGVVGLNSWERRLREQSVREAAVEPIWVIIGVFVLAGAVTVGAVLMSRRMPWLPTAAAVTLLYYLLASVPGGWGDELPYPGWAPRLHWSFTTVGFMVGVMSATAMWSWWSYLRTPGSGVSGAARDMLPH